jgi:hypothetical protein
MIVFLSRSSAGVGSSKRCLSKNNSRKRPLIMGPKEFRDIGEDQLKLK